MVKYLLIVITKNEPLKYLFQGNEVCHYNGILIAAGSKVRTSVAMGCSEISCLAAGKIETKTY